MKAFCGSSLVGALALLASYFGSARADDAVEIEQRWISGKIYSFSRTMSQELNVGAGDRKIQWKEENTSETSARLKLEGEKRLLVVRTNRVVEKKDAGPQKIEYDSAKPEETNPRIAAVFGALVGKEFEMLLDERGEPVSVENWDQISASFNGYEGGAMNAKKTMMDRVKETMLLGATPNHPVKPGDQWPLQVSLDMPPFGKFSVEGTMTLRSLGTRDGVRCAEIGEQAKILLQANKNGKDDAPSPLSVEIKDGEIVGTIWFDLSLGALREVELNQTMTIMRKNASDPEANVTLPLKQAVRAKLTGVEESK